MTPRSQTSWPAYSHLLWAGWGMHRENFPTGSIKYVVLLLLLLNYTSLIWILKEVLVLALLWLTICQKCHYSESFESLDCYKLLLHLAGCDTVKLCLKSVNFYVNVQLQLRQWPQLLWWPNKLASTYSSMPACGAGRLLLYHNNNRSMWNRAISARMTSQRCRYGSHFCQLSLSVYLNLVDRSLTKNLFDLFKMVNQHYYMHSKKRSILCIMILTKNIVT